MKLIINSEETVLLVQHKLLMPIGNGKFKLELKSPNPSKRLFIDVELEEAPIEEQSQEITEEAIKPKPKIKVSILEQFEIFKDLFPVHDGHGEFIKTRTLKRDPQRRALSKFKDLITKDGLESKDIINALKYDVWYRKKISQMTGENKLKYMPGLQPWLNDVEMIKSLIDQANSDKTYVYAAAKDEPAVGRKTNLF